MAIRTELVLRLDNSPGSLGRLCKVLADEKVNIAALNLEASGTVHLVPENPLHASGLLRGRDYAVEECEVLFVQIPNTVGAVTAATRQLATAGININYAFASVSSGHEVAVLVVGVDDAKRASAVAGM